MQTDWLNIPARNADFNALQNHALQNTTVISVLGGDANNAYGMLDITGPDSAKFLQGQLTCSMQDITPQQSRIGAHCTHKGRMVASFRLLQRSEQSYLFHLPAQTLPALQTALGKYIVFSKAKLRDASNEYLQLGISGAKAAEKIRAIFGSTPTVRDSQHIDDNGIVICVNETEPRFLCIIPAQHAKTVVDSLTASNTATVTDCSYWHWLDIRDGVGEVREQTIEEFIPQMLNMQRLDGISFTKGCYTGQEIVARMQYRGTLKKGMYRMAGQGQAPSPNTGIFESEAEQAVGHMVIAENVTPDQWEGLAVITHDAIMHPVQMADKQRIRLLPLPYAVTTAE